MLYGRYAAMAGMAAAALSLMAAPVAAQTPKTLDPTSSRPYSRKRVSKNRSWRGRTKKLAAGAYKGSRWAKRASKRGGNPARF